MARTCTVCAHEDAVLINEALVIQRAGNRRTAAQYGLSEQAIRRHRGHIPQLLVKSAEAEEIAQADDLVHEIKGMVRRVGAFIDKAEAADNGPEFRAHAAEWRKQVELLAKIAGELAQEGATTNYVFVSPAATEAIVSALRPYPEASYAVSDVLKELEANGKE